MFSKPGCPFCASARKLLQQRGMDAEEIHVGDAVSLRSVRAASGSDTVPQVFIDGEHVGDSDALAAWFAARESNAA
jgi:glutaredoxin-like protein